MAAAIGFWEGRAVGRYRFLEDVALSDCAVDLEGKDLNDLFETAAVALASVMVDPATLAITTEREITLAAAELDLLLFDWLSELIYRKDRDREVFPRAEVTVSGAGPYELRARLHGGVIDAGRTALGADPKAVTFHQFSLERVEDGWRARVVIDI
ncbi:MAG TPA: archease [Methylomirabilota bacterium]|nr:archease [Methylomirabilota bacterium]